MCAYPEVNENQIKLTASLAAANQNGTHPDFVKDPLGVVPSQATGQFSATLDLDKMQLTNITGPTGFCVSGFLVQKNIV